MSKNKSLKRLASGVLALTLVVGNATANLGAGWFFDSSETSITASAAEYSIVSEFNSATEDNPVLKLTQNGGEIYITRADGTVDLNGFSVTNLFLQNNDPNKTVTVKNGTINNKIDGATGYDNDYAGKVVLENLTVKGNTWADGHTITIKSGTYNTIKNSTNKATSAKSAVTIEGGTFNNLEIGSNGESYAISGGSFKNQPDNSWLAEGVFFIQNAEGQYVVAVAVTGVTLDKTTAQTVKVGENVAFTASVSPDNATDKTVKWSSSSANVKLYSDSACTTEVGTDATDVLTVYAKGITAGNATVTVTSNADSTKTASCDVTVNPLTYEIVWKNDDGTVLQSSQVAYGETPTYTGSTPTKASTVQNEYTFKGWDKELVAVTGEATYKAVFDSKRIGVALNRLAGENRYSTVVEISKAGFEKADTVVLAYGLNYADALAGVPLANKLNAPILLTDKDKLNAETLAEIKRLGAKNVIILGGEGVISADVEKALQAEELSTERIAGKTRFSTASAIADKINDKPTDVFFVYGLDFADALSVSTVAAIKNAPIIYLTTDGKLNAETAAYLASLKEKGCVKNAYVIGGTGVISDDMLTQAGDALGVAPTRVAGKNRYETGIQVNKTFEGLFTSDALCIATGLAYPDALAGGVFAAQKKAPLLLTASKLSETQSAMLKAKAPMTLNIFGGTGAVSDDVVKTIIDAVVNTPAAVPSEPLTQQK